MKGLAAVFLFLITIAGGIQKIYRINSYSKEAATAFANNNFTAAEQAYRYLVDSLQVQDDQLRLNLAHTYMKQQKQQQAKPHYQVLFNTSNKEIKSVSALQLGVIAARAEDYVNALSLFKQALIINPQNEAARYNYELLKKYLEEHPEKKKTPPPPQNKQDQQEKDQEQQEQKEQQEQPKPEPSDEGQEEQEADKQQSDAGEQQQDKQQQPDQQQNNGKDKENLGENGKEEEAKSGDQPGSEKGAAEEEADQGKGGAGRENVTDKDKRAQTQRERLQQMNISQEKANMILDAMRQAELQHLQQLPKKPTKQPDSNKPRW
ncbi:MAG: aerotolerance protein [Hymenobacteraceae bacterium]|nr:aerotolerance protein [Hymenobacteraceae bacterium]MDX5394789.1 aerotolerance protein [Hymenobacteraceae bacterium]MDX5510820.1 aerotolerance protein [Hymenobacteraceae bacterium]